MKLGGLPGSGERLEGEQSQGKMEQRFFEFYHDGPRSQTVRAKPSYPNNGYLRRDPDCCRAELR